MNLKYLPENFKKAIYELTEDEEFQKIYGEDKVLDDLLEQEDKAEQNYKELYKKVDRRQCQLVVDYILEHKDLCFGFFNLKLMKITNNKILGYIRNYLLNRMLDDVTKLEVVLRGYRNE